MKGLTFVLMLDILEIMKKIPLTQDKFASVDDIDYSFLMQWKWYYRSEGYAARKSRKSESRTSSGNQKTIHMHRVVLSRKLGHSDFQYTDHKNQNRLDNRRGNLRSASCSQNQRNKKSQQGTSKFKGVWWRKDHKKWQVHIWFEGCQKHLGYFTNEIEAAKAYNKAAMKYFKEFACLNEI